MAQIVVRPPSALSKAVPMIREVDAPPQLKLLMQSGGIQPDTRYFRMGKAKILVSPPTPRTGWHISISREDHYPDWDEVVAAWYSLVPDAAEREGMMLLPPLADYINVHEFCFQVHEVLKP